MGLKKILTVLVAVGALLTVSGCSVNSGGVAAVIDGQVLYEKDMLTTANDVTDILSADPSFANFSSMNFVLQNAIYEAAMQKAFGENQSPFTEDQHDQFWTTYYDPNSAVYQLWTDPRTRDNLTGYLDYNIVKLLESQGQDMTQVDAAIAQVPVTVNPRYGSWDLSALALTSMLTSQGTGSLGNPQTFSLPA